MAPLIDLALTSSVDQIVRYDLNQMSHLPDNYFPAATETILSLEPGSGNLMILLSERLGDNGGLQVTGGRRDLDDTTIVHTADRETAEESGILMSDKISLSFLVEELLVNGNFGVSPKLSFIGKPMPFYPVPEKERNKMTRWEWQSLLEFLWAIEEGAPGIFEPLIQHFKSPIYRKALYEYIKEMIDRHMIPPQDKVLKLLLPDEG